MYTLCQKCRTVYRVNAEQLRCGRGEAICNHCDIIFSTLEHLGDSIDETLASLTSCLLELPKLNHESAVATAHEPPAPEAAPVESEKHNHALELEPSSLEPFPHLEEPSDVGPSPIYWKIGAGGLALLLLVQLSYFESDRWAQNIHLRPPMEEICRWLGCTLPPFRNVAEIEIVNRALYPARDSIDGYEFHLVMVNHAPFPQPCPLLKLSLTAMDGTLIAERIFKPEEYLNPPHVPVMMPSHRMIFAQLEFASPAREIGGYQVEFLP